VARTIHARELWKAIDEGKPWPEDLNDWPKPKECDDGTV
jgi:hypothetical protein